MLGNRMFFVGKTQICVVENTRHPLVVINKAIRNKMDTNSNKFHPMHLPGIRRNQATWAPAGSGQKSLISFDGKNCQ